MDNTQHCVHIFVIGFKINPIILLESQDIIQRLEDSDGLRLFILSIICGALYNTLQIVSQLSINGLH